MGLPKIKIALNGWEYNIILNKVTSSFVDYQKVDTLEQISFKGVIQPLTSEDLKLKPLESRSWEWLMIHTKTFNELETGDLVEYKGKKFKVMMKKDYDLNGYYEYHLVKNYE